MLAPTEIYDNGEALTTRRIKGVEFGLELMEAVGAPRATITRLRDDVAAGVFTWTRMLRFEAVARGETEATLDRMRTEADADRKRSDPAS